MTSGYTGSMDGQVKGESSRVRDGPSSIDLDTGRMQQTLSIMHRPSRGNESDLASFSGS
jgi:hypothetical protein